MYKCGNSFFLHRSEWVTHCNKQKSPIPGQCECDRKVKEPDPKKEAAKLAKRVKRDPFRRK